VCTYGLMGIPYDQLTEEEKTRASLTDGLQVRQAPPANRQLQHYSLFLVHP
jgi:hypothetical protein